MHVCAGCAQHPWDWPPPFVTILIPCCSAGGMIASVRSSSTGVYPLPGSFARSSRLSGNGTFGPALHGEIIEFAAFDDLHAGGMRSSANPAPQPVLFLSRAYGISRRHTCNDAMRRYQRAGPGSPTVDRTDYGSMIRIADIEALHDNASPDQGAAAGGSALIPARATALGIARRRVARNVHRGRPAAPHGRRS